MNTCHTDSILKVKKRTALELPLKEMMAGFHRVYKEGNYQVPFTPLALISEITSQLAINKDSKIAVMFTCEWALFLRHQGYKNVTLVTDKDTKFFRGTCGLIGAEYITLDQIGKRKFDVVVGNPPFQDDKESSYTNLWSEIFNRSWQLVSESGILAMITPKTWATPKQEGRKSQTSAVKDIIAKHAFVVNLDECAKHFPSVGSSFTYTISSKGHKPKSVKLITQEDSFTVDNWPEIVNRLPRVLNERTLSIFEKVLTAPMMPREKKTGLIGEMIHDRDRNDGNKDRFKYRVQFSNGTVKWSDTEHRLQNHKKVLFPNQTTVNYPIYDAGVSAPPNRGAVFLVNSDVEGENLVNFVKSNLMRFVISNQRAHHGVLNTEVVSSIPKVDLTRTWTDEELYAHFNLTPEEIALIESNS